MLTVAIDHEVSDKLVRSQTKFIQAHKYLSVSPIHAISVYSLKRTIRLSMAWKSSHNLLRSEDGFTYQAESNAGQYKSICEKECPFEVLTWIVRIESMIMPPTSVKIAC